MLDKSDRSEPARRKPGRQNVLGWEAASAKALAGAERRVRSCLLCCGGKEKTYGACQEVPRCEPWGKKPTSLILSPSVVTQ